MPATLSQPAAPIRACLPCLSCGRNRLFVLGPGQACLSFCVRLRLYWIPPPAEGPAMSRRLSQPYTPAPTLLSGWLPSPRLEAAQVPWLLSPCLFDLFRSSLSKLALQGDARIAPRRPDIYSVRYTDGKVGQGQRAPQPRSARGRRGRSRPVGEEAPPQSPKVATFQPRAALLADPRCGPQPRALGRAARPRRLSMGGGHDGEATGPADSTNPAIRGLEDPE